MPASAERYLEVQRSEEFAQLRHRLRRFIFPTTVAFILWYALYVLLSAYARGFMGLKIDGNINDALLFGLLQFVTTFAIPRRSKPISPLATSSHPRPCTSQSASSSRDTGSCSRTATSA